MKCILILLTLFSLLLISCGHPDRISEKAEHVLKVGILKNYISEIIIHNHDYPPTNSIVFLEWVKSYSSSTNLLAEELRTNIDAVWINGRTDCWLANIDNKSSLASKTVLVAEYKVRDKNYRIGMNIDGELAGMTATNSMTKVAP
jgi:hypothetical protein